MRSKWLVINCGWRTERSFNDGWDWQGPPYRFVETTVIAGLAMR
jgi:hypothetical protein